MHGSLGTIVRAVRRLAHQNIDTIHFLGDFGMPWDDRDAQRWMLDYVSDKLTEHGSQALVTGGNHENYDEWAKIPADAADIRHVRENIAFLPRGWRAVSLGGTVVASFGGANFVDMPGRVRGNLGWWPAEQITEEDLAALGTANVDILLGHDAPMPVELQDRLAKQSHFWDPAGLAYAERGQSMFQRAVEQVRPTLTVSGHYHLHLDVLARFEGSDRIPFDTRVIVLNADGHPPTLAVLNVDEQVITYPVF